MADPNDKIDINVRIRIDAGTLQTIVANMKQQVGPDARGIYRIDTAEAVNRLVSQFLEESGFDAYARSSANCRKILGG